MTGQPQPDAYHLLRCLIQMAMADSVLHEAEERVLEHVVHSLGQLNAETWEDAWMATTTGKVSTQEVLDSVPDKPRLRRFILRELTSLAYADHHLDDTERHLLNQAAETFGLGPDLPRFLDWGRRSLAIFEEGEALVLADTDLVNL